MVKPKAFDEHEYEIMTLNEGTIMRIFTVGRGSLQKISAHSLAASAESSLATPRWFNTHPYSSHMSHQKLARHEQLKREERRQFDRRRIRFGYQSNETCALALDYSTVELCSKLNDEMALLSMCETHILEHANRRVDLFFYTLVAYYQTAMLPVEGHTNFQYGIGRNIEASGMQACHSSFTPSLLDETIFENEEGEIKYKSLLSRTHFLQSLNATVELPAFVNAFDDILESICRPRCLEILREVSLAKMNPIEGLTAFLGMMDTILQDFKQQAESEKYSSLTYPNFPALRRVNPNLIDLVIQGTLEASYDSTSNTVNDCYLQSLLRITPEEKKLCGRSAKRKEKIYLEKITAIQAEILGTESEERICAV